LFGSFQKSTGTVEKDYSIKITDEELFEACGRRSCRKGARGLHDVVVIPSKTATSDDRRDNGKMTTGGDIEKALKKVEKAEKALRKAEKADKKTRKAEKAARKAERVSKRAKKAEKALRKAKKAASQ
jgi:hypothetical protein